MRTPLIAGNWKMHKTLAEARELVRGIRDGLERLDGADRVHILVCPPFQHLFPMAKAVAGSPIHIGAQNVHEETSGAFTGEVSAPMLTDAACTHVIIGHSERRHVFGETGDRIARKVRTATAAGLTAVYCVGERLEERESGRTEEVVLRQLDEAICADTAGGRPAIPSDRLIIAYEPVWAIGTGLTATPQQAQAVHALLRAHVREAWGAERAGSLGILYGGSVKPGNAAGLLGQPDIDGALVGGACLVAEDFLAIISAAIGCATGKTPAESGA